MSRLRGVNFSPHPTEADMPSANRATTPIAMDEPQIEGRYALLGGYTVGFETYTADADLASHSDLHRCPNRRQSEHCGSGAKQQYLKRKFCHGHERQHLHFRQCRRLERH